MFGFFFLFIYLFFTYFPLSQVFFFFFFFFFFTNWSMTGLNWAGYAQVCHKLKDLAELLREAKW